MLMMDIPEHPMEEDEEGSGSEEEETSERCLWAEEDAEDEDDTDTDLYGEVWPEPSLPEQDVVVVTSVVPSRNQAPGQVWEVLPHVPSVISIATESSVDSHGASWEEG